MTTNKITELFWNLEKPSTKWSGYFDVYERYLSKFVGKAPRILEIGILGGGSIELWLKYFGEGTSVTGLDIDPKVLDYKYDGNAMIVVGDQSNPVFWDQFLSTQEKYDIVIDDGSHIMDHQITTLNKIFPHIKEGGVYICEDTHTSYWPHHWGGVFRGAGTFVEHSKRVTDILNQQFFQGTPLSEDALSTYNNLYSVAFYNSMVVMEKEQLKPFGITDNLANIGRELCE